MFFTIFPSCRRGRIIVNLTEAFENPWATFNADIGRMRSSEIMKVKG